MLDAYIHPILSFLAICFVFALGLMVILTIFMYVIDITQTKHTIRRNYPVLGRFRYWFEHLGEFFRQYFFAMDREELPFNRAERGWVYRSCKNLDTNLAFGSTRDLTPTGSYLFLNSAFPILDEHAQSSPAVTLGPYCQHPYTTHSILNISGMSFGALSQPAVEALSRGAAKAGCWMNTGEGGLSPHHLVGGADIVFQIGTAKYGVRHGDGTLDTEKLATIAAHPQVKMFELKLSQGAKPGKGGILPGAKVTEEIAAIRGIPVGQPSISPNAHPEIRSVDDLLDMIAVIRKATGKPVGFKAVIGEESWISDLFTVINKRGIESAPDFITIDSSDGGSGAAPQSLLDYVGLPIKETLPWMADQLTAYGLKERIKLVVSGKLVTPAKVAWALACGADFVTTARGFMFSLGCIQAMQCNKNTCPTGITTHDPKLQRGLIPSDKAERVAHYYTNTIHAVEMIAHSCGVSHPRLLKRKHVRVVLENGRSIPLSDMHPAPIQLMEPVQSVANQEKIV